MISNGHRSGWIRYFLPSFAQMFFLIVFVGIYSGGADSILKDGDTGYHIRAGEIIMREMAVQQNDPFSFISPPLPWTAHEWLSEVVMALAHKAVGLAGVVFLFALLLSVTYWVLFRAIRTFRRNILVDLLVIILVVSSSQIHWLARPHAFSLLLTVLLYHVLILHQEDRGYYLYLIPPMMLLWVNLHGGFIAGFLFLAIFLTGYFVRYIFSSEKEERPFSAKKGKQLFMVSAVSFLAACVNPYGFHAFLFPFRLVSDTYLMDNVSEFLSPNFHGFLPYRYLLLSLIGILGFSRVALSVTESILVLLFTSMSLYSVRYIPLCAIVYAPILSKYGDILLGQSKGKVVRWLRTRTEVYETIDAGAKGYAILIAAMAVFTVLSVTGKVSPRFPEKMAPMDAIDFLRKNPIQGNMFNNDEIGDYVIYGLYPQYKVFVDGRLDMYGTPIIKEYKKVVAIEPGWRGVLDKYNINYIFFYTDSVLVQHLLTDAGWKGIYSDNVASIFLRNIPENAEIIARYSSDGTVPGKGH